MTQSFRLGVGGRIDRARPIAFIFDGAHYEGCAGDTLASALLANGVRLVGRSFKYHRPRGVMAAGVEEPNAIVDVVCGGVRLANLRATEVELVEGLEASSVNAWPSLGFDFGAVNSWIARFLPAGFYYKTFIQPHWHLYEWAIRRAAGLGRLSREASAPRFDHRYAHCDVLVVGGGPCGLAAAKAAAASGARVILAEQGVEPGGTALWRDVTIDGMSVRTWVETVATALNGARNARILTRTTAQGYYDHNGLMLVERLSLTHQRLWQVRAQRVVLATGATERPLVFPGNDRPGVMLASAAQEYVSRFGVKLGERALIVTNNDSAYDAARALEAAGVQIAAVVDTRKVSASKWHGLVHGGAAIVATKGAPVVTHTRVRLSDGSETSIACDLVAMSGGWNPAAHLFAQSGGRLAFDDKLAAFAPHASVQAERSIGAANGCFDLNSALAEATAAGAGAEAPQAPRGGAFAIEQDWAPPSAPGKAFVDFQNDVTTDDIALAARENFVSVEHMKRYTTLGMATDQGKTANVNAIGFMGALTARAPKAVGTTRYRPPFTPVAVGAYAGRRRGELWHAERRTPIYDWHAGRGAVFEAFGEWSRPAYYLKGGDTREEAMAREALVVRRNAGLFDNTPLGKIEVVGPDAARFLDFIYANAMSSLKVGRLRYGLMLNEQGVIVDDGVAARLGEDRFWVGTTSGGAQRIAGLLEEWLQCEFVDYRVLIAPQTADWSAPTITGPNAREMLRKVGTDIDVANEAFPHMAFRDGQVAGIPARVFRVSFTGELSYEIYVAADRGLELWQKLATAGAEPVGIDAWMLLRTEKGYLHVGSDTDGTTTPDDVGWGHVLKRPDDFAGKRSLLRPANRRDDRWQLVGLEPLDPQTPLEPGDHLQSAVAPTEGYVTSAGFSPTLGRTVAMGMLKGGHRRLGEEFSLASKPGRVRVVDRVAYDQKGARLHA